MAKQKVDQLIKEDGFIEVTSTSVGGSQTKKRVLKVRPFVTTPAHVEVKMGAWFPTGEMRGAKIDVTLRVPCYVEELVPVYSEVSRLVDNIMDKAVARLSGEDVFEEDAG